MQIETYQEERIESSILATQYYTSSSDGGNSNYYGSLSLGHNDKCDTIKTQNQDNSQKVVCIIDIDTCPTISA